MSELVMPKNSASIEHVMGAMQIYYDAGDWLSNADYITEFKRRFGPIGDDTDSSAYTKRTEIGSYYGFLEWQDFKSSSSPRRITERGRAFVDHYNSEDTDSVFEDIMLSLEEVTFGRNNFACHTSDSDIEPPALFMRAMVDLNYITNTEFAYMAYEMSYDGKQYTDLIREIKQKRMQHLSVDVHADANRFKDPKALLILERWRVLVSKKVGNLKQTSISPEFFNKYADRIKNLKIYNIDKNGTDLRRRTICGTGPVKPRNVILYGVPGCGKSHEIEVNYCSEKKYMERTVFHPDYSYSDFVGQILPQVFTDKDDKKHITYKFEPGPFTKIMQKAYSDEEKKPYFLIIEEINRGNAPAIFGDVFQLLDRDSSGESRYGISNESIASEMYGEEHKDDLVKIPSNLYVLATMNTSDQNVFTLDTAFKRRWSMKRIKNEVDECSFADHEIFGTGVTWRTFVTVVNKMVVDSSIENLSNDDNRLGSYFVEEAELDDPEMFAEKVLMYLWNDAFKYSRENVFASNIRTLDDLIDGFINTGFDVFVDKDLFSVDDKYKKPDVTIEQLLSSKNESIIEIYTKLREMVKNKIPEMTEGCEQSLDAASWSAPGISKPSFAEVVFQGDKLVISTEIPSEQELRDIGEETQFDGDHHHCYDIAFDESRIDDIVIVIVDSYEQLRESNA